MHYCDKEIGHLVFRYVYIEGLKQQVKGHSHNEQQTEQSEKGLPFIIKMIGLAQEIPDFGYRRHGDISEEN